MNASEAAPSLEQLSRCTSAFRLWFLRNGLLLNADKSETVLLGTAQQLRANTVCTVDVAGVPLPVQSKVRSLGVTFDSHLRFDAHASEVARICNFHTRGLRHVRRLLSDDIAQTIACSVVASRLDYCNALFYGAPESTFQVLQRAQNNLARVVCQRNGRTDAKPLLRSLHWLPVRQRVTYKMALLAHKVRVTSTPGYLRDLLNTSAPIRQLRSSSAPSLTMPRTRTEIGRAFSVAAPTVWNTLPASVRNCSSTAIFKKHLKTYLFTCTN